MEEISWSEFERIQLAAGTIVEVLDFPKARKPAYKIKVDFGHLGVKQSSAQVTKFYRKEQLIGKQVLAVVNFPKKQIADFMSECLITGIPTGEGGVVLVHPERKVPNGALLA